MKKIYELLWEKAKPYYLKGREMDISHIKWMIKDALYLCEKEGLDDSLLVPLVILHDVGYSECSKVNIRNSFRKDVKKEHMEKGAKIALKILKDINYEEEKIQKIVYYVSVHDNWVFDENELFVKDMILGSFTDLDFIWMATKEGFPFFFDLLNKNAKELIDWLSNNDKLVKRPFVTKTAKKLFEDYLNDRRKESL